VLTSSRIRKYSITRSAASCCSGLNVSDGCGDGDDDGLGEADDADGDGATIVVLPHGEGLFETPDDPPQPESTNITGNATTTAAIRISCRTITHTSIGAPQPPEQEDATDPR
jgi:hypothetical protein